MSEAKRHLGKNMKPRGEIAEGQAEGQESGVVSGFVDQVKPELNDGIAASEISQKSDIVAETEDISAKMAEFMAPPEDVGGESTESFANLQNLMDQSRAEKWIKEKAAEEDGALVSAGGLVLPTAEEIAAIESGERLPNPPLLKLDGETGKVEVVIEGAGPQPNGDYGVLVMVPEQLVSGVLGQAEMDGVTPSEWLTTRLAEYLGGWFFGR